MTPDQTSRHGFSLVEVALALLVVGVGLLTVFSLFPAGLDMNKRAIDDSQAALFAEDVFAGLRAQMTTSALAAASIKIPPTMYNVWNTRKHDLTVIGDNRLHTNVYESYFADGLVDYAVRYKLKVETDGDLVTAQLDLYNGAVGPTNDPMVFYTEMYRPDMTW